MMQKFMILLLSVFSTMVVAETELLVERKGQEVHFVYPDLEEDGAYYYAMWSDEKKDCEKIDLNFKALVLSNAHNRLYRLPAKGGSLCFRRSDEMLDIDWDRFQIRVDDKSLKIEDDDSRSVSDTKPQPLEDEKKGNLLSCQFINSNCELKL